MANRKRRALQLTADASKYLDNALEEVESELEEQELTRKMAAETDGEGFDHQKWQRHNDRAVVEKCKIVAIQCAHTGRYSQVEIANKLGCALSAVNRWLRRVRCGGGDVMAVSAVLKIWRHRKTPLNNPEVFIPFLKAARTGEITSGTAAAHWLNSHFGKKLRKKFSRREGLRWLMRLPQPNDHQHVSDQDLKKSYEKHLLASLPPWHKKAQV